ncbi:MAG TPA: hypothetical protein VGW74_01130 [Propionibacteriaceae bacterium]|nr:hypothetical protein [Propionibacteriaceae bacterium]
MNSNGHKLTWHVPRRSTDERLPLSVTITKGRSTIEPGLDQAPDLLQRPRQLTGQTPTLP